MSTDDKIIILLLIIVSIIFISFIIYSFADEKNDRSYNNCPDGECATNIFTGIKRCPAGDFVSYNPVTEVCNPKYSCTGNTPYALQSDGSTDDQGRCEKDVICQCLKEPACEYYILGKFRSFSGNTNEPLPNQRTSFSMSTVSEDILGFETSRIILNQPGEFCSVPVSFLQRSIPGCANIDMRTIQDVSQCMLNKPCLNGTLAFIATDLPLTPTPTNDQLMRRSLSCVAGSECKDDEVAYYTNEGLKCSKIT